MFPCGGHVHTGLGQGGSNPNVIWAGPTGSNKLAIAPVPILKPWEAQNTAGAAASEASDYRGTEGRNSLSHSNHCSFSHATVMWTFNFLDP